MVLIYIASIQILQNPLMGGGGPGALGLAKKIDMSKINKNKSFSH